MTILKKILLCLIIFIFLIILIIYFAATIEVREERKYILKGKYGIQPCVYKIGWSERYIVALQYEMEFGVDREPDKTKPQYYIIDLEKEEQIGPLTKEEFYEYDCSSIKMKNTILFD